MIVFKRVWGTNFGSFAEFDFPFESGKHMVSGINRDTNFSESNGAGKSHLFESISWCFYKRTLREKNISRDGKGKCLVGVEFSIEDDLYEIIRTYDKKDSNKVKVSCNGENISPRNTENIEDVIDRIIGIPYDLFVIVVTVIQGLPINLSTMTPTIRKGVLEDMMGLNSWDSFNKLFQKEKQLLLATHSELDNQYSVVEGKMIAKNSEVETLRTATGKANNNFKDELREIKKQLSEARSNLNYLESKREMCSTEEPVTLRESLDTIKSSCSIIEEQMKTLIDLIEDGICPTCGQNYPVSMVADARMKLEAYDDKLPKMKSKVRGLESLLDGINLMDNDIYAAKRELRILNNNLGGIIARMDDQTEETTESISDTQKELNELVAEVNDLNAQLKDMEVKLNGVSYILSLLLPSSPFRTRVLEKYLSFVNTILAEISPSILDSMIISLCVSQKESGVDIQINDGKRGYKSLSGGEKRRADIIIILSLQRFLLECAGVSTNLLVFDEIFDSLDNTGIQMILNCIDMIFDENLCIYIITHKNDFKTSFESIIEVEKVNEISSVVQQ